jgi:hypothetical protein
LVRGLDPPLQTLFAEDVAATGYHDGWVVGVELFFADGAVQGGERGDEGSGILRRSHDVFLLVKLRFVGKVGLEVGRKRVVE